MNHCGGGPGTDTFDRMAMIEEWISKGGAPDHIVATPWTAGKVN